MTGRLSRREFLEGAAVGGAMLAAYGLGRRAFGAEAADWPAMPPVKIYKVFVGRTGGYMARPTEE